MSMRTKNRGLGLDSKRQVTFKTKQAEAVGFMLLGRLRKSFTYLGQGKYVITKEQCIILKSNNVAYEIKRYYS